ncbi:hypothetical protein HOC99_01945 [Candidatus Woesearchaeota archaeon]|jgi:hypothetical protein|nr:hypothetical protein [Candidatus Woesearchaeota archaeon]MBT4595671.1 hypothetical protein [Candidatus Woesearchaeota archaeon]MBT7296035.1 hypothetical protein [Candidatus Woesearchaeota archaeon]MBT7962259.1 hypothetical protein [Candidatus Woesearchaeota archaeon]
MDIVNFVKSKILKLKRDEKISYYNLSNNYNKNLVNNLFDLDNNDGINNNINSQNKDCFFIDGGLGLLFESNSVYIYAIRVSCVKFIGNKFIKKENHNFKLVTYLDKNSNGRLRIYNKIFCEEHTQKLFNYDFDLFNDQKLFNIENYDFFDFNNLKLSGSVILKLLELIYVQKLSNKNSIIVRDGSFEMKNKIDQDIICNFNINSTIFGISKNSSFVDQDGNNLSMRLFDLLGEKFNQIKNSNLILSDFFGYQNILSNNYECIKVYLVKLNTNSNNFFRIDVMSHKEKTNDINIALNIIKQNSIDNAILGYPYGLILVDQLARISNRESEFEKISLFYSDKKLKSILEHNSYNKDFHKILDNLQY